MIHGLMRGTNLLHRRENFKTSHEKRANGHHRTNVLLLTIILLILNREHWNGLKIAHEGNKVQKHNSFNTNTPSSESYRNQPYCRLYKVICEAMDCFELDQNRCRLRPYVDTLIIIQVKQHEMTF